MTMIQVFVWIVIVCIIAALALWVIQQLSSDAQINRVARIAIVCIAVLVILGLAAGLFGINLGVPTP
jgi:uncharacterized membrane protein YvlD (DUF360 family)